MAAIASLNATFLVTKKTVKGAAPAKTVCVFNAEKMGKAAAAGALALTLAVAPVNAATVKLGSDSGALVFEPSTITVAKGEKITFVNNRGFPHNVVFDEDEIPGGVDADAISHEDYLNGPGDEVSNVFDTPGSYSYYCEPHQGAGMVGKIIVQ
uniref:Plastocyanin n=1 Tax=Pyramimonas obovata TaxID=1411642 RepID=A0A7S0RD38_9CHLO|mmetsp:Transcript_31457/g.68777  ORF Transcript_31457/g.68777 Transcript_31457/m.68777 type:complete len:153 (+) Transcript_31457:82-540(+)